MDKRFVVIVNDGRDGLTQSVSEAFVLRGIECRVLRAQDLSSTSLDFDGSTARIDGVAISAVLFHARPDGFFSEGAEGEDRDFCDQETKALWLAIQWCGIASSNRVDAEVWYSHSEWSVWLRRFIEMGMNVAPLRLGDIDGVGKKCWLPWGGGSSHAPGPSARRFFAPLQIDDTNLVRDLVIYGQALEKKATTSVSQVADTLRARGINFAEVLSTMSGQLAGCTVFPTVADDVKDQVAAMIVEGMIEDLDRRR